MPKHGSRFLFVSLALTLALTLGAQAQHFKTLDVPNASETDLNAVNTAKTIVGDYIDTNGVNHGVVIVSGKMQSFDVPSSTGTWARGVNDKQDIVGWFADSGGTQHGYVLSGGKYTTIDPPNTILTNAWGINNAGAIVGTYVDGTNGIYHGFTLVNGAYTTYDAPNGATLTELLGINSKNVMVGIYIDSSSVQHGFGLVGNTFKDISYPGAGVTAADKINDTNSVVGLEGPSGGPYSGYILLNAKTFKAIMAPGSSETRIRGLNNGPTVVVGRYSDQNGVIHGLVVTP